MTRKARNQYLSVVEEVNLYDISMDSREIFLHGEPGPDNEDSGIDYRVSNKFLKNLRLLEQSGNDSIIIHQNGIGGEVDAGLMIYNAILHSPNHITLIMHGSAYSMSTIIAQAADLRLLMPDCLFLLHSGSTEISGTYKQAQSQAKMEKELEETMLNIYIKSMIKGKFFKDKNMDEKKIRKFLDDRLDKMEDWWIFPEEVINLGLADKIFGTQGYENINAIKENIKSG